MGALALAAALLLGCGASSTAEGRDADDGVDRGDDVEATPADDGGQTGGGDDDGDGQGATPTTEPAPTDQTTAPQPSAINGSVVSADDGTPVAGAVLSAGDRSITTASDGSFTLEIGRDQEILVRRPTFLPLTVSVSPSNDELTITIEPVLARGLRVSRGVAADPERFQDLLDLIEGTTVNSLVFDTKDETGQVLYETGVEAASRLHAVNAIYRPEELLAEAAEHGLYPITRVVTFEDRIWSSADPEAKLAGAWVDATDEANWAYPIALAEEACRLGFAEVQFDYVRYPAGRTATAAADRVPATAAERAAVIGSFLAQAADRLEPLGCGVSAAIFGIVMSSETDEGIGQTVETVGAEVDAVSPMLYPSHYGPGWLGFADPNEHPGPVVADALDDGMPRLPDGPQMRPWIQAFYYNGAQIVAQIDEAESRGAGWLLWNASGNYRDDWLPKADR